MSLPPRARWGVALALTLGACANCPTTGPSSPGTMVKIPNDSRSAAFEAWLEAEHLFARGQSDAAVDDLLVAARIMARQPARGFEGAIDGEPGAPTGPLRPVTIASAEGALAAAQAIAGDHAPTLERIAAASRVLPPAETLGPQRAHRTLGAGGRDFVTWSLAAGDIGEVAALGDGRGDLDLWVVDDHFATVCADVEGRDEARCRWVAAPGTHYDVVIKNVGKSATRYVLLVR